MGNPTPTTTGAGQRGGPDGSGGRGAGAARSKGAAQLEGDPGVAVSGEKQICENRLM